MIAHQRCSGLYITTTLYFEALSPLKKPQYKNTIIKAAAKY
jgi:hypothetical protein